MHLHLNYGTFLQPFLEVEMTNSPAMPKDTILMNEEVCMLMIQNWKWKLQVQVAVAVINMINAMPVKGNYVD